MAARRCPHAFIALTLLPLLALLGRAEHESAGARRTVDPLGTRRDGGGTPSTAAAAQQQQLLQEKQRRMFVPLKKRARAGGAVYGVDVSEAGISRRKLERDGAVELQEGEREACVQDRQPGHPPYGCATAWLWCALRCVAARRPRTAASLDPIVMRVHRFRLCSLLEVRRWVARSTSRRARGSRT